jgi:phage-related protein
MDGFIEFIEKDLPKLLDDGVKFVTNIVNGILQNLPQIISSAGQLMAKFIEAVYKAFPQILAAGAELLVNIVQGIIQNLPEIAKAALDVATQIVTTIGENYPQFIQSGIETIGNLVKGLIDSIPDVISGIGQITSQALESFNSVDWASIGSNIISGIVSGISGAAGTLFSSLRGLAEDALGAAKKKLKIESPSKVFADEVGQWIPAGIAEGVEDNMSTLSKSIGSISSMATIDGATLSSAHRYGATLAQSTSGGNVINMTIYGAKGQSETELAEIISRKINAQVNRRSAAWA